MSFAPGRWMDRVFYAICRGAQRDGPADARARADDEQGFVFE
jgi:hypothetical protein